MQKNDKTTYNQKYIPMVAVIVALVMMVSFIVALLNFSNNSKNSKDDHKTQSYESTASSSVEINDESSAHISVPDVVVPEEPKNTQYYHNFVFSDLEMDNAEIANGTLAVVKSDNKYFPKVDDSKLTNIYANMTPKKYGLSGVALDVQTDAFKSFDDLFVKFSDAMPDQNIIINKAYVNKNDGTAGNGSLELSTGYCLEISSVKDEKASFLIEQAYRYGVIQRYPEEKNVYTGYDDGTNIFRYVGTAHSYYMNYYKFCLEEYLDKLRTEKIIEFKSGIENNTFYVVYYVPADLSNSTTKIPVPSNEGYSYNISGDGTKGFVVSVKIPL